MSDNGVYKSKAYIDGLAKRHQEMTYPGVVSHEQNGVTERAIQTVVNFSKNHDASSMTTLAGTV